MMRCVRILLLNISFVIGEAHRQTDSFVGHLLVRGIPEWELWVQVTSPCNPHFLFILWTERILGIHIFYIHASADHLGQAERWSETHAFVLSSQPSICDPQTKTNCSFFPVDARLQRSIVGDGFYKIIEAHQPSWKGRLVRKSEFKAHERRCVKLKVGAFSSLFKNKLTNIVMFTNVKSHSVCVVSHATTFVV